jgi:hypothetical protein
MATIPINNAHLWEEEEEGEEDDYMSDSEVTLCSIDKSKTISFSIRANYTKWAPREAFRELVQNWYIIFSQLTLLSLPIYLSPSC